jgi:CrcB protein
VTVLLLMVAGAAGAVARFAGDAAIQRRGDGSYPWGTFCINVSGCLLLGLITGWYDHHGGRVLRDVAGTGFCGAFTTFSAFSIESIQLVEARRYLTAARYILTSLAAGGIAAAAGLALVR